MRAKFHVESVTHDGHGQAVKMFAVHSGSPEDNQFSEATPSGRLEMYISNPAALDFLEPNKSYYLDFSPAAK